MKATCPNNKDHNQFTTTAHVMQEWKVDANGNFLETTHESLEVTHGPQVENYWHCAICNAEAIVEG